MYMKSIEKLNEREARVNSTKMKKIDKRAMRDGSHALLNKVLEDQLCGCNIVGAGNLPSPIRIVFCKTHAAATELLKAVHELLDLPSVKYGSDGAAIVADRMGRAAVAKAKGKTKTK